MTAPFTIPLPTYQCHKRVQALKISHVLPSVRGYTLGFDDQRYAPMEIGFDFMKKHSPEPGMYVVWYEDGYVSVSPAAAFESGYTLVDADKARDWSAFQYEWPGGPSEVDAALASRDAEIERLKQFITDKIWERLDADQVGGAPLEIVIKPFSTGNRDVGPATQAAVAADLARYGIDSPGEAQDALDASAPSGWQRDLVGLRYAEHIRGFFESMFDPWMTESDKDKMVSEVLGLTGVTLRVMDEEIQAGVDNGYSPEHQMAMARSLLGSREAWK